MGKMLGTRTNAGGIGVAKSWREKKGCAPASRVEWVVWTGLVGAGRKKGRGMGLRGKQRLRKMRVKFPFCIQKGGVFLEKRENSKQGRDRGRERLTATEGRTTRKVRTGWTVP